MPLDLSLLKLANIFRPDPNQIGMDMPSQGGITGMMDRNSGPTFGVSATPPTFGGDPSDISQAQQPQSQMQSQPDLSTTIQQLLNPSDQQFKNYTDMIAKMPQRANYQPSTFRRIMATIGGLGAGGPVGIADGQVVGYKADVPKGLETQQMIKNAPYNKALSDWSNQLDPLAKAAQMEATRNTNLRQIGLGEMARATAQQRADTAEERAKNDAAYQQGRLDKQQQRIDFNNWKQAHPNSVIRENSDGNMVGIDPQTNQATIITNSETGEPVKSSIFTDAEKYNQQQENRMKQIAAQGDQTRQTATLRSTQALANAKELENVKAIDKANLKVIPAPARPGTTTSGNKPLTPSAQATDNINKAIGIVNEHPELQQYFVYGGNKKPTGELVNPTKNDQDAGYQIAQRLMSQKGTDISLNSSASPTQIPNVQPQTAPVTRPELSRPTTEDPRIKAAKAKVKEGRVLITDGAGHFGQVIPEDIPKLPKGWMVVK